MNAFSGGVVELSKKAEGALAGTPAVASATFTVLVTCQVPVVVQTDTAPGDETLATVFSGKVDIGANETIRLDTLRLPVGARCFGVETETGGATRSTVTPSTFADAQPVAAGSPEREQVLTIAAVNTFDAPVRTGALPSTGVGSVGAPALLASLLLLLGGLLLLAGRSAQRRSRAQHS
ncbi:hypothetical protein B0I08_106292 [Glaciihabitans tibetensis]|uniref:DUF5979 domain-containing protein n=1 Tax=Glaciihabitans tibetensis TaxID=1266600 RepID=A0A2T0VBY4_9MICO|nr:DUF5979 domain-containing protein [Glaciihabitans tibetensis]PRY67684.1 hypothetical protein B0I08_106292 [Glaciihabitans tibetensis]